MALYLQLDNTPSSLIPVAEYIFALRSLTRARGLAVALTSPSDGCGWLHQSDVWPAAPSVPDDRFNTTPDDLSHIPIGL